MTVTLMGVALAFSSRGALAMDDSSIRTAVDAWLSNPAAAEATYGHISTWNTGRVTDMDKLFSFWTGAVRYFNEPIGNWDVRKVKNMHNMFQNAESFNQALGKWQVGAVTDMSDMFQRAASFNQPLNDWDLSNVQNMEEMFEEGVPPGSGQAALLYSGKRVCRPPGGRGGADEGYVGRSGSLGSSMGSIWATACPRTWPFGGVHVQSGVRKGPPTSDLCSTD